MTTGYDIHSYGRMIEDPVRMGAYGAALRKHVKAGMVVVELGSGPGIMAMMACQLGASRVYAIEPDPSIDLARRLAQTNGFDDRIVCIRKLSTDVELPERGDLLLSDLRGTLPLLEHHIGSIKDARERLLKPGAQQLPQRDTLMVGLARDDGEFARLQRPWRANTLGLDLRAGYDFGINMLRGVDQKSNVSLGVGQAWGVVDYRTVESPNVSGRVEFSPPAGERVNGLELWFEAEVCDGIGYSTGPDQPSQVYGRGWLPLQDELVVGEAETITVELAMNLVNGAYLTRWTTSIGRPGDAAPRLRFRQSTLGSAVLSQSELKRFDLAHAPVAADRTRAAQFALAQFDGQRSVASIAAALRADFPQAFRSDQVAVDFVRDLARRYCPDA